MNKYYWIGGTVVIVLLGVYGYNKTSSSSYSSAQKQDQSQAQSSPQSETPKTGTVAVNIKGFAFNPSTLTIAVGTTVVWTNNDSATHTINSATFNSGNLAQGQTFKQTFTVAGTYSYSCGIHPSMQGTIIVK
jgi:plastocyanin